MAQGELAGLSMVQQMIQNSESMDDKIREAKKEAKTVRKNVSIQFHPDITVGQEKVMERENILKLDFSTTTINEKWAGDIAYIHSLKDGWTYLAPVIDLHTK